MKKILIVILVAVLLVFGACVVYFHSIYLTDSEKYVLKQVSDYRENLRYPDSMKILGEIVLMANTMEDTISGQKNYYTYVFFNVSGTNDLGKEIPVTICYVNGECLGDINEFPEVPELFQEEPEVAQKYTWADLAYSGWKLYGENFPEHEDSFLQAERISGEKIAQRIGASYSSKYAYLYF